MKSFHSCLAFAVILVAAATAHAQTVTPLPAPTIIKTVPYPITASGYYQLGADLTYNGNTAIANDAIITINAPNVTLDFGGHYISGPATNMATTLYGIYSTERAGLKIINGTISHCYIGVELFGNGTATSQNINQLVNNMLVTHCYAVGIDLTYVSNAKVTNCTVSFIGGTTAPTYNGNNYSGIAAGIAFEYSGGTGSYANNNTVASITAGANQGYGIFAPSVNASNNTIDTVTGTNAAYGIELANLAVGNNISNTSIGLELCAKYKDNMTYNCTTPYDGGTAVGNNG